MDVWLNPLPLHCLCTRDGTPQVAVVPLPLAYNTAVHVFFCLLSSIEGLFLLEPVS